MRVLSAGRASEILDLGGDRVLRRFKSGGDPAREAAVMGHAREHGYPVPEVFEVRADALVLELVDGPTMADDVRRRPWRAVRHARTLARLHERLHEIPFEGSRLLHLDLHPENVLLSPGGPVVIDWANAEPGDPALDVALTWVIGATVGNAGASLFTRLFLRHVDREAARRALPAAVAYRLADRNVTDAERKRASSLLARETR